MSDNFQNKLFHEVGLVFEPLTTLNSTYRVTQLFRELGYEPPGGDHFPDFPGLAANVESVIQKLILFDQATPEKKNQALLETTSALISLTKEVIDLVEKIKAAVAAFPAFISNAPIDQLPLRLLNYLIIEYTRRNRSGMHAIFSLLGIFDTESLPANATLFQPATSLKKIVWSRLPKLLTDPAGLFEEVYQWNSGFQSQKLFENVNSVLRAFLLPGGLYTQSPTLKGALGNTSDGLKELRFPLLQNATYPATYSQFGINITPAEAKGSSKPGFAIVPYLYGEANFNFNVSDKFEIVFESTASVDAGLGLIIRPDEIQFLTSLFTAPQDALSLNATLTAREKENAGELVLFGKENATRLAIQGPQVKIFLVKGTDDDAGFEVKLDAIRLVVKGGDGDGFLNKILGDGGINAEAGFTLGYAAKKGFYFVGSGGLELKLATHITLGPLEIQGLLIAVKINDGGLALEGGAAFKVTLGPLAASVDNMGVRGNLTFPADGGNMGPANLDIGFKPPNGVGLAINAGAVTGGGYLYFDFDKEEYAGAIELSIAGFISAKAFGIITTKMPDGSKGFSLLVIITVEFNPPYQLGYGFTLMAVGGLLGLNRTVLLDPLREGVRTGAVNNILFPQNVVANAPRIISDLKAIFPAHEGKFLVGPMGKLGYGTPTLITLTLGIIIEIPGNFAILGVLRIVLPDEKANIVRIQVAFVGTIDFDKKLLAFDASLFESNILFMTLEGDMAVRLKWGDSPNFLLSVGGFHPAYTPPPLSLPTLKRLAINILNTDVAKIRVECYQAVTSNTVQFGCHAELFFGFSAISIEGHFGFDALFQFSPFYFTVAISGSVSLKLFGTGIFSIRLALSLEGPTPWRAKGSGTLTLLFFDISADFDKTWGDTQNTTLEDIVILPKLLEELARKQSWRTAISPGRDILVSLRKFAEGEGAPDPPLILHPSGDLIVQQKLLPLSVKIEKVGAQKTRDIQKVVITAANSNGIALTIASVDEDFARAQYQVLSDAEKLSKPSFEKMPGGVRISLGTGTIRNGKMVRKSVEYEQTIVDKEAIADPKGRTVKIAGSLFTHFLKGNSVSRAALSSAQREKLKPFKDTVLFEQEGYSVVFQTTNKSLNASATFKSEMMAHSYMQEQIKSNPALRKEIQVVPNFEVQDI